MTWVDLVLVVLMASLVALGARRRLTGLVVGVGGAVAVKPLLLLAERSVVAAVLAALGGGLLLGFLGRNAFPEGRNGRIWQGALGGVGGATLGVSLVLAMVTALPIQRSPFDPNQLLYPPQNLPPIVQGGVRDAATVAWGRDVLLFPLLVAQDMVPEERRPLLQGLNRWFVVGEPWRVDGEGG